MTLNYWMIVERYPNLKEEVGGSIPGCEISSLLDRNLALASRPSILKQKKEDVMVVNERGEPTTTQNMILSI